MYRYSCLELSKKLLEIADNIDDKIKYGRVYELKRNVVELKEIADYLYYLEVDAILSGKEGVDLKKWIFGE